MRAFLFSPPHWEHTLCRHRHRHKHKKERLATPRTLNEWMRHWHWQWPSKRRSNGKHSYPLTSLSLSLSSLLSSSSSQSPCVGLLGQNLHSFFARQNNQLVPFFPITCVLFSDFPAVLRGFFCTHHHHQRQLPFAFTFLLLIIKKITTFSSIAPPEMSPCAHRLHLI